MKPTQNRRVRPRRLRGPETLEERYLLSGTSAAHDFYRLDPAESLIFASKSNAAPSGYA